MTIANGRGPLALIPKLKTFAEAVAANIAALAAEIGTFYEWPASMAKPNLIRLCDQPEDLVQPKSPALILTLTGRDTVTPRILYDYSISLAYVYASPKENTWGDDALYACSLAAEAVHLAIVQNVPATSGINSINYNSFNISELMESQTNVPHLARILSLDLTFQVEEDF